MCLGFGGFYSKDGKVYFTAPDEDGDCSHSKTAAQMSEWINEEDLVPFEAAKWTIASFAWHVRLAPNWADSKAKKIVLAVMKQVKPIVKEYKKVTDSAWARYLKNGEAECSETEKADGEAEYQRTEKAARAEMVEKLSMIDGYLGK